MGADQLTETALFLPRRWLRGPGGVRRVEVPQTDGVPSDGADEQRHGDSGIQRCEHRHRRQRDGDDATQ